MVYSYLSFDGKRSLHCVSLHFNIRDESGPLLGKFEKDKDFLKIRKYCYKLMSWEHLVLSKSQYILEIQNKLDSFFSSKRISNVLKNHVLILSSAKIIAKNYFRRIHHFFSVQSVLFHLSNCDRTKENVCKALL